jgi:di/tricarboxylate transporter
MTNSAWFTLTLLVIMIAGLVRYSHLADVIFLGGLALLGMTGILTPQEALAGISNPAMLTVAALFVVATGLRETGALEVFARRVMARPDGERRILLRLTAPVAAMSAVLNNTTIVAMTMPAVVDWCRKHRLAASRLLIPLDYATIAGGMITLIGTSTNLVVHGLMIAAGLNGFGFLELGAVGVPITLATLAYLTLLGPRLLPRRQELLERLEAARREYLVEMQVEPTCPLIGQTIAEAGLRHLPGLFLVEITRGEEVLSPVTPDEVLRGGDRLCFAGVVSTIVDLQKTRGLRPVDVAQPPSGAAAQASSPEAHATHLVAQPLSAEVPQASSRKPQASHGRHLCEAVISVSSPLVGRGIREANFRTVYDAAVIAVHRSGQRLTGKIGDIVLRAGDTLLLQTSTGFVRAHRNNPDFYLVSEVAEAKPVRHEKAWLSISILITLVLVMAAPDILQWLGFTVEGGYATLGHWATLINHGQALFAIAAAVAMVASRCVSGASARRSIQWDTLFVIAASFGIATAMEKTGLAAALVDACKPVLMTAGPLAALATVYILTNVLTELLTNNAAAALLFPIALSTAGGLGLDARPFAVAVAVAASGGFVVPIGYQTHMMVFGPGGYRLGDFAKVGLPLNFVWFVVTMIVVPLFWPLK